MNDIIAAISTSSGTGAISIIKVSGPGSIELVNKLFKGKNLEKEASHTIHYGFIMDSWEIIDEVLISIMKAPKTFTKEDVVEINCHGGYVITNKVLETLLKNGARQAEPGEFTKRAFLNGRIDLTQAEAVMDIINVKNEQARKMALNLLNGNTSKKIRNLRQNILQLLASIEVNIDYPEYEDIEDITNEKLIKPLNDTIRSLKELVIESENGQLVKTGIKTVIIGKPNVGKSSLLNKLINEDKAIVTNIEGTTRDTVEGTINLNGILLNIIDTAGIRKTENIVEKIGVTKSINLIEEADLVILVLNNNDDINEEENQLLNKIKTKKSIIVINKNDLETKIDFNKLGGFNILKTNTIDENGIDPLKNKIIEMFNQNLIESKDQTYLSNARQISLAKNALSILEETKTKLNDNIPVDMLELDIKNSWNLLGEIIGETYTEELIDQLFSQFCLGK